MRFFAERHSGWACDAMYGEGGCLSGIDDFYQTKGMPVYACAECNYDLCELCASEAATAAAKVDHKAAQAAAPAAAAPAPAVTAPAAATAAAPAPAPAPGGRHWRSFPTGSTDAGVAQLLAMGITASHQTAQRAMELADGDMEVAAELILTGMIYVVAKAGF